MESLEELLESITSTLQSQYSSRFIRVSNPMALNATPEVLELNIYAICSLWLSDALSENALDGGPVGDTEVAATFLGFAKLFLEGPDSLLVHWAEVMVAEAMAVDSRAVGMAVPMVVDWRAVASMAGASMAVASKAVASRAVGWKAELTEAAWVGLSVELVAAGAKEV